MATILGSNPDATNSADPTVYCKDFVRKHDYESFLTSQFYPKETQGGYFALKAFYVCIRDVLHRCTFVKLICEGRVSDDTGHSIDLYAWEDEDAVLERRR
jgi:hypothetical protein